MNSLDVLAWYVLSFIMTDAIAALIAYHPSVTKENATPNSVELSKAIFAYALIGMICGFIISIRNDSTIGFVIFGIGSLMRFRTDLSTPSETGRVMLVSLIGLCCGLNMQYLAVLFTAATWLAIYFLEREIVTTLVIDLPETVQTGDAVTCYKEAISEAGVRLMRSKRSGTKTQIELTLQIPPHLSQQQLATELRQVVPESMRGELSWQSA